MVTYGCGRSRLHARLSSLTRGSRCDGRVLGLSVHHECVGRVIAPSGTPQVHTLVGPHLESGRGGGIPFAGDSFRWSQYGYMVRSCAESPFLVRRPPGTYSPAQPNTKPPWPPCRCFSMRSWVCVCHCKHRSGYCRYAPAPRSALPGAPG